MQTLHGFDEAREERQLAGANPQRLHARRVCFGRMNGTQSDESLGEGVYGVGHGGALLVGKGLAPPAIAPSSFLVSACAASHKAASSANASYSG